MECADDVRCVRAAVSQRLIVVDCVAESCLV